jgi:hypothetical protein
MKNGELLLKDVYEKLYPIVHRAGSNILLKELNFLQQAVIHLRQSRPQMNLYAAFEKYKKKIGNNNFLFAYQKLFPVHNHPGSLLIRRESQTKRSIEKKRPLKLDRTDGTDVDTTVDDTSSISDDDDEDEDEPWWDEVKSRYPNLGDISHGPKVVLLLHILAHADIVGTLTIEIV